MVSGQRKSKFHNKSKLFINKIIRFFHPETLENIYMPQYIRDLSAEFVDSCRKTARELVDGKVIKTDLFNHSHYKVLFLKLDKATIDIMKLCSKDVSLHK